MSTFFKKLQDLAGIGQWKRKSGGDTAFLVVWLAVAFSVLGFGVWFALNDSKNVLERVPELKARPIRSASDADAGEGIFQGKLRGPARKSPSGNDVVAWYAWLDRVVTRGKNTTRERLCTVYEMDGLSLEEGGQRTPLDLRAQTVHAGPASGGGSLVRMIGDATEPGTPASILSRPECKSPDSSPLEYHEIVWTDGREVVFSGLRSTKGLGPSDKPIDFLASECGPSTNGCEDAKRGKEFVIHDWVSGATWVTSIALVIASVFITLLGGISLGRHRAMQKQRRVVARRLA